MDRMFLLASAALFLAACENPRQPLSADFGNSVHQNIAVQLVNPEAGKSPEPDPTWYGNPAANAIDRYFRGKVRQPAIYSDDGKNFQIAPTGDVNSGNGH